MNLYHDNGYANIPEILRQGVPFSFVIGGRGTGKTYGALKYVLENNVKFCLMRRTQSQLETIAKVETNPFKSVVRDLGYDWNCDPYPAGKSIFAYRETYTGEDGKTEQGETLGYAVALSTISNLRGFDMTDVDILIYDEFIPERHERALKNESDAFLNAYETINRNRELQGKKALKVLALANANDFASPLMIGLGLVSTIERMISKGKEFYINPQKGIGVYLLNDSPISKEKALTSLYKLTIGTAYNDMAINNAFDGSRDDDIKSVNLAEYVPQVGIGEVCVYKHKSESSYYISAHFSGSVRQYSGDGVDMKRFLDTHRYLLIAIINGDVLYESHFIKALFLRYCGFV